MGCYENALAKNCSSSLSRVGGTDPVKAMALIRHQSCLFQEATERPRMFRLEAAFATWVRFEPHALQGQNTAPNSPGYPTHQRKCGKHPRTVTLSSGNNHPQMLAVYTLCVYILFPCFTGGTVHPKDRLCVLINRVSPPGSVAVPWETPNHVHASIWLEALIFRGQILLQAHPTLWLGLVAHSSSAASGGGILSPSSLLSFTTQDPNFECNSIT